jgi:tetratricopeptide (TPR) repeat protein
MGIINFTELNNSMNFYLPIVSEIKSFFLEVIIITTLVLIFSLIILLILWMFGVLGRGTVVLPFEVTLDQTIYSGRAISDLLISELHRINCINNTAYEGIKIAREKIDLPQLAPSKEIIDRSVGNLGTVGVGESQVAIGNVLMILKRLWPLGDPGSTLTGSLHKHGSTFTLIARFEDNKICTWNVSRAIYTDNELPDMVRDLAFMIAKDRSFECKAKTWNGFKYYIEAMDNYHLFIKTKDLRYLQNARDCCIRSMKIEGDYESLVDLFYNLGLAYLNQKDLSQAKEMFLHIISIKPKANAYFGLGNYYLSRREYDNALLTFEIAAKLDPNGPYSWNGIGDVYAAKLQGVKIDHDYKQCLCKVCREAIEAYDKAIKIDQKNIYSWNGKGKVFNYMIEMGCIEFLEKSINAYTNAILLDSNYNVDNICGEIPIFHPIYRNTYSWNGIGNAYTAMVKNGSIGFYGLANDAYNCSIAIDPALPYPWNAIGELNAIMMEKTKTSVDYYKNAISAYNKALNIKQDYGISKEGICRAHRDAKNYDKAKKCYEELIKSGHVSASAYISLAECYKNSGSELQIKSVYNDLEDALKKGLVKPRLNKIYCKHEKELLNNNVDFKSFKNLLDR